MERLLAGDQNAAPADAHVERDAQGRMVSVSQTLSPGGTAAPDIDHPRLVLGEGLRGRLGDACAQAMNELLAKKLQIYERYWSRDDDDWKPCSFGWPSDHDPEAVKANFTAPHLLGGALDISIGKMVRKTIYRFERVGDALKVTDQLIDWGEDFVWPVAP